MQVRLVPDESDVAGHSTPVRERVLITGGAGFIGSHVADLLLSSGREVIAYDNMDSQVHGSAERTAYLAPEVELIKGDVRDAETLPRSVLDLASMLAAALDRPYLRPTITNLHRAGDIRHCFADISKARRPLGYAPRVPLEHGLVEPFESLAGQEPIDHVGRAAAELPARQFTR
jgi:nucleoside-diphosphate-sugar epimerase